MAQSYTAPKALLRGHSSSCLPNVISTTSQDAFTRTGLQQVRPAALQIASILACNQLLLVSACNQMTGRLAICRDQVLQRIMTRVMLRATHQKMRLIGQRLSPSRHLLPTSGRFILFMSPTQTDPQMWYPFPPQLQMSCSGALLFQPT